MTRQPGDLPCLKPSNAVGCDGREHNMTTIRKAALAIPSDLASIASVAVLGAVILFVAGFAQADALHGSTHDTRHAAGFACH